MHSVLGSNITCLCK